MANVGLPVQTLPGTVLETDGLKDSGSVITQRDKGRPNLVQEGRGRNSVTFLDTAAGSALANANYYPALGNSPFRPGFGRSIQIKQIVFEADSACYLYLRTTIDENNDVLGPGITGAERDTLLNPWIQPFDSAGRLEISGDDQILSEFDRLVLYVSSTASVKPKVKVTVHYLILTRDINYSSDSVYLSIGDSISESSVGVDTSGKLFTADSMYSFRMANWLNLNGKNVRIVNKSRQNTTSELAVYMLKNGFYDEIPYDIMTVAFGMNDAEASRGVTVSKFTDNLKQFIYHRNQKRPNADIIILAPPVTDSASRVSTIAAYRSACLAVANDSIIGTSARGVYYYDFSTAFSLAVNPATDLNNISSERSAGNRIHPSGYGHGEMWDNVPNGGLKSVVQQTRYFLSSNR